MREYVRAATALQAGQRLPWRMVAPQSTQARGCGAVRGRAVRLGLHAVEQ